MEAYYEIAGIKLHLETPFIWRNTAAFLPFLCKDRGGREEVHIVFRPRKTPIYSENERIKGERYVLVADESKNYIGYRIYNQPCFAWREEWENEITCWYLSEKKKYLLNDRQLFYIICLEQLLNQRNGFVLHSSFIRWNGKGILFSAPAGTGKSTQAELWKRYEQGEILNGDKTAVRKINGNWRAFGFPFAGSSDIYRNESAPLMAVIVLRQAGENKIVRLNQTAAFRKIYSETTIHPWDMDFVNRMIEDLINFTREIPVYLLSCRPEKEAVNLVKKTLEELENGK